MKKWIACIALLCLLTMLGGCFSNAGGKQDDDDAKTLLGMAVIADSKASGTEASLHAVAAVVLTDEEEKIISCRLDEVELSPTIEAGTLKDVTDFSTKRELGDAYGMKAAGAKQEWYEQADAFCKYVVGMTANEVANIETKDGKATDADLSAGCTIAVTDFMAAVSMAAKDAKESAAKASDKLGLAITATRYTGSEDTEPRYDILFSGAAVGAEDKVSACRVDELQKSFTITNGMFAEDSGEVLTKGMQKDDYGMKSASGIGLEWYEQAENLQTYLADKTAAEIAQTPLTDGKATDISSGCTITVTDMLKSVQKAMKNAI